MCGVSMNWYVPLKLVTTILNIPGTSFIKTAGYTVTGYTALQTTA
jgi:hypothetical protein